MAWDNKTSMKDGFLAFLVKDNDGKVDLDTSVARFRAYAVKYLAGQAADEELVAKCLHSLFDQYRGANLNLDFIKSQTVALMKAEVPELGDPSLYLRLCARVEEYLHENTNRPAVEAKGDKPAVEAVVGKAFNSKRGKSAGFTRVSDQAAP